MAYLRQMRFPQIARLLTSTALSISEAAHSVWLERSELRQPLLPRPLPRLTD
jgi:hypothetical protein